MSRYDSADDMAEWVTTGQEHADTNATTRRHDRPLSTQPCTGCNQTYYRTGPPEADWFCHFCQQAAAADERGAHERETEER